MIVVIFATGIIGSLTAGGVSTPLTAGGQAVVPGSRGSLAVVTLDLRNSDNRQIDNIAVSCPNVQADVSTPCGHIWMVYSGANVTGATPLPLERTAVGSASLQANSGWQFYSGTTYTFLMTVNFAGGSQQILDVEVTAVS